MMKRHIQAFVNIWRNDHTTPDLKSVIESMPVVFLLGLFVICFMWYDMQNRFTRVGNEILASQAQIRHAQTSADSAARAAAKLQGYLEQAEINLAQAEDNSKKIQQTLELSQRLVARSNGNRDRLAMAEARVADSIRQIDDLRKTNDTLRQTQVVSDHLTHEAGELINGLLDGQARIERLLSEEGKEGQKSQELIVGLMMGQRKTIAKLDELNTKIGRLPSSTSK